MATTFIEKQQKALLKKFYTLLGKIGAGTQGKEAILHSYGVESSRDLSVHDLMDICDKLTMQADPKLKELDVWRKRVMAAIGGWLRATGGEENAAYIKSVACRAARRERFNDIPPAELRNVYNEFLNKRKTHDRVNTIDAERVLGVISLN
jgi:hypothetical protein